MSDPETDNPILKAWAATVASRSNATAIFAPSGDCIRTFLAMESDARDLDALVAGLAPGNVVALQTGNDARLPSLLIALWRRKLIPMPLDLSLDRAALSNALTISRASSIIVQDRGHLVAQGLATPDSAPPKADFLKLTSGTTGLPRVIRFTAGQVLADCHAVCDTMGITAADVNYGAIPWSHSYGFSNLVTPLLCRGISVVATEERLPRAILNGLASSHATVFPGIPIIFQKLAELSPEPIPCLRLCISAGAPLQAVIARAFREKFGVKIHSFYGSSECGGIAYDPTNDEAPEGCVGFPMRGVRIEFDHDNDPSRIRVESAAVGEGYFPETDPALSGGRFAPGDLIRRTPAGLVIAGRVSDFINVAGRKLNPAEVEAAILGCAGVRAVIVFGVSSQLRGEEPIACVAGDATKAELQAHCARVLAGWQLPRDFWLVQSLPVSERGKINRRAIADAYLASVAAPPT